MTSIPASSRQTTGRRGLVSLAVTLAAGLTSVITVAALFVSASEAARNAESNGEFPRSILGILMFTGFREDGRFGVHAASGLLVFPILVLVVAVLTSIPVLRSFAAGR